MRASRGEIKIEEILSEAGLPFKMEYSKKKKKRVIMGDPFVLILQYLMMMEKLIL